MEATRSWIAVTAAGAAIVIGVVAGVAIAFASGEARYTFVFSGVLAVVGAIAAAFAAYRARDREAVLVQATLRMIEREALAESLRSGYAWFNHEAMRPATSPSDFIVLRDQARAAIKEAEEDLPRVAGITSSDQLERFARTLSELRILDALLDQAAAERKSK